MVLFWVRTELAGWRRMGYQSCDARSTKTAKHIVPELLRTEYHLTSYIQVVRDRINNRLPGIDLRGVRILDGV